MRECECWERVNEAMKEHNACLDLQWGINLNANTFSKSMTVPLRKVEKSRKRIPALVARFCPLCGTDLKED